MLPPGWLEVGDEPSLTGSVPTVKTTESLQLSASRRAPPGCSGQVILGTTVGLQFLPEGKKRHSTHLPVASFCGCSVAPVT